MSRKTLFLAFSVLVVASMILAACAQPTPETVTVKETEVVVETQVVTEEKVVVVTATAPPPPPAEPHGKYKSDAMAQVLTITMVN
jgi:uncharacterized lipoprotein YajG